MYKNLYVKANKFPLLLIGKIHNEFTHITHRSPRKILYGLLFCENQKRNKRMLYLWNKNKGKNINKKNK